MSQPDPVEESIAERVEPGSSGVRAGPWNPFADCAGAAMCRTGVPVVGPVRGACGAFST